MIFTPDDIQRLFTIVDYRLARTIADILGKEFLTDNDKKVLDEFHFDWKDLKLIPPYWQAYLFGRLSAVLTPKQLQTLNYTDIKQYTARKQYKQPSKRELYEYQAAATRSYSYIKGMGERVKKTLSNSVSEQEIKNLVENRRIEELSTIKREHELGVLEKRSVQGIVSNIGNQLKDWNRDWGRIVETEFQNIYELGNAQMIINQHGLDARVYKEVYPGACRYCLNLYTTAGAGSKPRIFKLSELIQNGDNIGRKSKDWKPVIGTVHPFCYDDKTEVLTNEGFKFFKDLNKTESFLSINLETGDAEYVKAVNWIDQEYKGDMILRKHKSFSLMTTPNHNHVISKRNGPWKLIPEGSINKWSNKFLRTIPNWSGQSITSIRFGNRSYDSKLFYQFLGYFLSEGSTIEYDTRRIHIAQSENKYLQKIFDCCVELFPQANKCSSYVEIRCRKGIEDDLWEYMCQFGHSHEKFIPSEVKEADKEGIEIFLDAFREGDGSIHKGRNWDDYQCKDNRVFSTSSPRLASDLGELMLKIGRRPSYRNMGKVVVFDKKRQQTYTSKYDQIYIDECFNTTAVSEALQPQIIKYDGRIYDVELEKYHTLIIRREGKVCVSGNCRCGTRYIPDDYVWDDKLQTFVPPKDYKSKVERKSKVTIIVGDKKFLV